MEPERDPKCSGMPPSAVRGWLATNQQHQTMGLHELDNIQILYEIRVRENSELSKKLLQYKNQLDGDKAALAQLTNICNQYDARHDAAKKEIDSIKMELSASDHKVGELTERNSHLTKELDQYKFLVEDLQSQLRLINAGRDMQRLDERTWKTINHAHNQEAPALHSNTKTMNDALKEKCSNEANICYNPETLPESVGQHQSPPDDLLVKRLQTELAGAKMANEKLQNFSGMLKEKLEEKEHVMGELKSRDLLYTKLTAAFIYDFNNLAANISNDMPECTSQVEKLRLSDEVSFLKLFEHVHKSLKEDSPIIKIREISRTVSAKK